MYNALSVAYRLNGNFPEALAYAAKALEFDSENETLKQNYAMCLALV